MRLAHRPCAFSVAIISNIVHAEWPEFDLEADVPTWMIPRKKMKAQDRPHDHKVILHPAIAEQLRERRRVVGRKGFVFPSPTGGKFITRESLEKAYRVTMSLKESTPRTGGERRSRLSPGTKALSATPSSPRSTMSTTMTLREPTTAASG